MNYSIRAFFIVIYHAQLSNILKTTGTNNKIKLCFLKSQAYTNNILTVN